MEPGGAAKSGGARPMGVSPAHGRFEMF